MQLSVNLGDFNSSAESLKQLRLLQKYVLRVEEGIFYDTILTVA
jgi:hypothetical protein